jgi:hypothetical protein
VVESELAMSEDLYNSKYKDKLELSYKVLTKLFIIGLFIYNPRCCFSRTSLEMKKNIF